MQTMPSQRTRRLARPGFTIIELMVVLLLIGVLMGIAAINLPGMLNRGKERATRASMQVISSALSEYRMSNNTYPPNNGLEVLITQEYLSKRSDISDSWGQPIEFLTPSQVQGMDVEYTLRSAGRDGIFDTADDIIFWPGMDN
jgi:general secretion pathway protein G